MSIIKNKSKKSPSEPSKALEIAYDYSKRPKKSYSTGGMVELKDKFKEKLGEKVMSKSITKAIMERRKKMKSPDEPIDSIEEPSVMDEMNEEIVDEPLYEDDLADFPQPEDSNLKGDDLEDSEEHSMISKIRAKMKSKKGV